MTTLPKSPSIAAEWEQEETDTTPRVSQAPSKTVRAFLEKYGASGGEKEQMMGIFDAESSDVNGSSVCESEGADGSSYHPSVAIDSIEKAVGTVGEKSVQKAQCSNLPAIAEKNAIFDTGPSHDDAYVKTTSTTATTAGSDGDVDTYTSQTASRSSCTQGNASRVNLPGYEESSAASTLTYGSTASSRIPDAPRMRQFCNISEAAWENGYDSDGNQGPFYDAVELEGEQIYDEEALVEAVADLPGDVSTAGGTSEDVFVLLTQDEINKLKVAELKEELKKRGIKGKGKKAELQEQLIKAMEEKRPVLSQASLSASTGDASMQWMPLVPEDACVEEPQNSVDCRAPTVPEEEAGIIPVKHNFQETFPRPDFEGKFHAVQRRRNGSVRKDNRGHLLTQELPLLNGRVNPTFILENGLHTSSSPAEWFAAFCPTTLPKNDQRKFHMAKWTTYTNLKAVLMNAGQPDSIYPSWKPFTTREIEQHLFLYVFNGLSPSPRIEMKFRSQRDDPVNGSDFICRCFGPGGTLRHKGRQRKHNF
mmetsp:Transcript_3515/g.5447  ORF Transcript_3515/g.5447 Transcript_3515/m.5447 type:complete len:534 (-) Transcript_3515:133-1734(-)